MIPVGPDDQRVIFGKIGGLYGVRGWVKVFSYAQPKENILAYKQWQFFIGGQWRWIGLENGRVHGKGLVAKLQGYDDRDVAASLVGLDVAVRREDLPDANGSYYWIDLIGLSVQGIDGYPFGTVTNLMETGANDVLVVKAENRERLIPFVRPQVVTEVDLVNRTMRVDWDPEF
jgi:16S rRNA processing protein RimM